MFDESLFDQPAEPLKEGDFLYHYEIRSWESLPWVPKIIGASAILNVLLVVVVGQASFLTAKGCDSPLVSRVCQVLDTVVVGSALFGTDREYVDAVYEKTQLADADITFVDVSGAEPKFEYPEGYFQVANPEQAMVQNDIMSNSSVFSNMPNYTPPPPPSADLMNVTPQLPKVNPNPVVGNLPSGFGDSKPPAGTKGRGGKLMLGNANTSTGPNAANSASNPTVANTSPSPAPTPINSQSVEAIQINKKPLTDFADSVVAKWASKQIDLSQKFTVSLDGVLTPDGKLDPVKSRWDPKKEQGDPQMIEVVKEALEAVGDSGLFAYLKALEVDKFNISLVQDDNQITAIITSSQKSPERAKTLSSGMNGLLSLGKMKAKNPSDELTLMQGAAVTTQGNNFVLNFAIPKPVAQEMINRKLQEAQTKQQQQPSGSSTVQQTPDTAKF